MGKIYGTRERMAGGWGTPRLVGGCRTSSADTRINWAGLGTAYCVKRVDQTDVIVPAEDVR